MNDEALHSLIAGRLTTGHVRDRSSGRKERLPGCVRISSECLLMMIRTVLFSIELTSPDAGGEEASCHVGYRSCFYRSHR